MLRYLLQLAVSVAFGMYIIHFARSTYSFPEAKRRRWYSVLPEQEWSSTVLRCLAVVWIFSGFLFIANGVILFPFFDQYRGIELVLILVVLAAGATAIVISMTPKRKWSGR